MNATEDLLHRELRITDTQVTINDEDLMHAQHRYLRRRRELVRQRRSWTAVGAAAATALAVGGAAVAVQVLIRPAENVTPADTEPQPLPQPEVLPLTRNNVAGVWLAQVTPPEIPGIQSNGWLFEFRSDEQLVALNPGDPTSGRSVQPQPYTLTSTGFLMPDNVCDLDASLDSFGLMHLTTVRVPEPEFRREGLQENCAGTVGEQVTFVKLSPRAISGASIGESVQVPEEATRPVRFPRELMGVWIKQGTGTLLMVTQEGLTEDYVYHLDDDGKLIAAPRDEGTIVVDDLGNVVLRSSADSAGCLPGSEVAVTDVRTWVDRTLPLNEALVGTATADGCTLHEVMTGIWIRVS